MQLFYSPDIAFFTLQFTHVFWAFFPSYKNCNRMTILCGGLWFWKSFSILWELEWKLWSTIENFKLIFGHFKDYWQARGQVPVQSPKPQKSQKREKRNLTSGLVTKILCTTHHHTHPTPDSEMKISFIFPFILAYLRARDLVNKWKQKYL